MSSFARAMAKWLSVSVAVVVLQACGGGGGDDGGGAAPPAPPPPPPAVTAPSALSYSSPQTYTTGTAITAISPTVTGTVTGYAVAPALPAGLAIDATTGAISGTPTQATAAADYTVTASNSGGSTTFPLNVTVNDPPPAQAPPSGLTYTSPQTYTVGTAITALTPTVTGTVSSYAAAPALPAGLAIDATTGVISGTPTAIAAAADYTITATNSAGSTTFALSLATGLERVTTDRDDGANKDIQQVHVLYVVPYVAPLSPALDRNLDTNGTIQGTVRNWNKWLGDQTGGPKLRLDTYGADARLDVSFLQLSESESTYVGTGGGGVRTRLEFLLLGKGFDATNKIYLVYYEGAGAGCGSGAWPPTLHGTVSVLFLRGTGTVDCSLATFAGENDPTGDWEYRGVHEVLHPLGLAADCAPNENGGGHVGDDTRDLLYSGTLPALSPKRLDLAHNDYFGGGGPVGCPDLMNSAYLDPKPAGPQEPPEHPYLNLATTADCSLETSTPIAATADNATITFVNAYAPGGVGTALSVVQLAPSAGGNIRTNVNSLPYLNGLTLNGASTTPAKVGTIYAVTTVGTPGLMNGTCQAIITATATPGRYVIRATP